MAQNDHTTVPTIRTFAQDAERARSGNGPAPTTDTTPPESEADSEAATTDDGLTPIPMAKDTAEEVHPDTTPTISAQQRTGESEADDGGVELAALDNTSDTQDGMDADVADSDETGGDDSPIIPPFSSVQAAQSPDVRLSESGEVEELDDHSPDNDPEATKSHDVEAEDDIGGATFISDKKGRRYGFFTPLVTAVQDWFTEKQQPTEPASRNTITRSSRREKTIKEAARDSSLAPKDDAEAVKERLQTQVDTPVPETDTSISVKPKSDTETSWSHYVEQASSEQDAHKASNTEQKTSDASEAHAETADAVTPSHTSTEDESDEKGTQYTEPKPASLEAIINRRDVKDRDTTKNIQEEGREKETAPKGSDESVVPNVEPDTSRTPTNTESVINESSVINANDTVYGVTTDSDTNKGDADAESTEPAPAPTEPRPASSEHAYQTSDPTDTPVPGPVTQTEESATPPDPQPKKPEHNDEVTAESESTAPRNSDAETEPNISVPDTHPSESIEPSASKNEPDTTTSVTTPEAVTPPSPPVAPTSESDTDQVTVTESETATPSSYDSYQPPEPAAEPSREAVAKETVTAPEQTTDFSGKREPVSGYDSYQPPQEPHESPTPEPKAPQPATEATPTQPAQPNQPDQAPTQPDVAATATTENTAAERRWRAVPPTKRSLSIPKFALAIITAAALGVGVASWWLASYNQTETPTVMTEVPQHFRAERAVALLFTPNQNTLVETLATQNSPQNQVVQYYFEETVQDEATVVQADDLFGVLAWENARTLTRTVDSISFGSFTGEPFLVLKVNDTDRAFVGLLDWEQSMSSDLAPWFGEPVQRTFDPSSRAVRQLEPAFFADEVVANTDVRVLRDEEGTARITHALINGRTILITTTPELVAEIRNILQ